MPDSRDYKNAMEKVTAGQRWKQTTLEKMQAQQAAKPSARRAIPFRRAIPLAAAAAVCLLVIPVAARSLTPASGGATGADQASPRAALREAPQSSADAANEAAPFALAAAPDAAMAGEGAQNRSSITAAPAYTTVEADSPEAVLPADALPVDGADGLDRALDRLDQILTAEGEGRTRSDLLASGLTVDGSLAFVLPGDESGSYRLYLVTPDE